MDGSEDGAYHRAGDGHLCQLEGDGTSVTHDTRPDLDQLEVQGTPIMVIWSLDLLSTLIVVS